MDDKQWEVALQEACIFSNPCKLRELFVIIVVHCYAANGLYLWNTFKEELSDDIRYRIENTVGSPIEFSDEIFNTALLDIQAKLSSASNGKTMADHGLPTPHSTNSTDAMNQEYFRATHCDSQYLEEIIQNGVPKLNMEQTHAFNTILNDVEKGVGKSYYLDAPGRTGMILQCSCVS